MTPAVTVDSKPSGLPIATTSWPRRSALESPSVAAGRLRTESARSSARSVSGSSPSGARFHHDGLRVCQPQFARAIDDMAIGEDKAIRRDDDAGADAACGAAILVLAACLNADNSRTDTIGDADHGIGIGIEQRRIGRAHCRHDWSSIDTVLFIRIENSTGVLISTHG